MLTLLAEIAEILALLLYIPAFITVFLILKKFRISSIRNARYFKFLMLQVFIHSLFLVLAVFFVGFRSAFFIYSFAMVPIYALLVLRLYNLKNSWQATTAYIRRSEPKTKIKPIPKIDPERLQGLRIVKKWKSQWH